MLQPALILSFPGNQMAEDDCELFARFGCEEVKGGCWTRSCCEMGRIGLLHHYVLARSSFSDQIDTTKQRINGTGWIILDADTKFGGEEKSKTDFHSFKE